MKLIEIVQVKNTKQLMFGLKKLDARLEKIPVLTKSTPDLLLTELHVRFMQKALEHCKNKSPATTS
jgi:hypothetical protein